MFSVHYSYMSLGSTTRDSLAVQPQHVRESLETALATVPHDHNWEIRDSVTDRVVASYALGITAPHPSLLARQLLSQLSLASSAYDSIGDIEVCTDVLTQDDSGAWVLSPEIGSRTAGGNGAGGSRYRTTPVHGLVGFEIEPPDTDHPPDTITIHHSSGRVRVDRRFLELRPVRGSKGKGSPVPRWDLVVLNRGLDGNPCSTASRVYARLGPDAFAVAAILGVAVREPVDPNALPVAWKKGLITIGSNGNRVERIGWVRDIFGIDKRQVEVEGYGGYKYMTSRYHLTHPPSGCLIEHCKRRTSIELIADTLRVEVPELARQTGEGIGEEIGQKVGAVIQRLRDEAGWQWDR